MNHYLLLLKNERINLIMVSIIVINYNSFEQTCSCLESIFKHEKELEFEIILVDNGSTECSPYLFLEKFPSIKLVSNGVNLGFAKGNNSGILISSGDHILLLNSDTFLLNNAVERTLSEMTRNDTMLSTCKVLNEDRTVQPVCSFFPSIRIAFLGFIGFIQIARFFGLKKIEYKYDYTTSHSVDWIWGCFFMFNRKILDLFPDRKLSEDFFMYGEDLQWCYFLKCKNIFPHYYPGGEIVHLFSGNKYSLNPDTNLTIRNYIKFLKKNYSFFRYSLIFLFETLTSLTRLRLRYLFKRIFLYFTLN
jgi:GT2 family glycosyltransferase